MNRTRVEGFRFAVRGPGESVLAIGEQALVTVAPDVPPSVQRLPLEKPDDVEVRGEQVLLTSGETRRLGRIGDQTVIEEVSLPGTPDAMMTTFFESIVDEAACTTEIICHRIDGAHYTLTGLERLDTEFAIVRMFQGVNQPVLICGNPPSDIGVYRINRSDRGRYSVGHELPELRGLHFLGVVSGYAVGADSFGEQVVSVSLADETVLNFDTSRLADNGDIVDIFAPALGGYTSTNGIIPLATENGYIAALDPAFGSSVYYLGWREGILTLVEDENVAWARGPDEPLDLVRLDAEHCAVTLRDGVAFSPFARL